MGDEADHKVRVEEARVTVPRCEGLQANERFEFVDLQRHSGEAGDDEVTQQLALLLPTDGLQEVTESFVIAALTARDVAQLGDLLLDVETRPRLGELLQDEGSLRPPGLVTGKSDEPVWLTEVTQKVLAQVIVRVVHC